MSSKRTALVLGATGGIGGETAIALRSRGWHVRCLHRQPERAARGASHLAGVEWIAGDSMRPEDVVAAARGADAIVHGVNPPGYRNWNRLVLPMLESTIAAARGSGARIVLPGTVYNFGPDAFPVLGESSPQRPQTRKGRIRVEMERRLEAAARDGVRTLIVRAGDFFGPRNTGNSWFAECLVRPARPVRAIVYPGRPDVGHAWAYVPDVAATVVLLLDREAGLGRFDVFHHGGHWLEPGIDMAHAIERVVGAPTPRLRRLPWALVWAASPFVATFHEMLELRYLWQRPVRLDNARLVAFLGSEPHTPLDAAVRATLAGLGCLSGAGIGAEGVAASPGRPSPVGR
jgi:nucleoside-diphosphate-sugar epimerase